MRRKKKGGLHKLVLQPSIELSGEADQAGHDVHSKKLEEIMLILDSKKGEFTKLMTKSIDELAEIFTSEEVLDLSKKWALELEFENLDDCDGCAYAEFMQVKKTHLDDIEHFVRIVHDWAAEVHEKMEEKKDTKDTKEEAKE